MVQEQPSFVERRAGGRFWVDVTGPFLAKFGRMLSPDVVMVAAIMDADWNNASLDVAVGLPGGSHGDGRARDARALDGLAGVIGATAWPGQAGDEVSAGELEAATAEIVAGLSVEDVEAQLAHVAADRRAKRHAAEWKCTRRSCT